MYFIFFVMPLLSVIKVTAQGRYAQKNTKSFSDILLFNSVVFFATAVILAVIFLRAFPPIELIIYAVLGGIFTIAFQTFYLLAFKNGPVAPTVIINSFSIVLVLLAGRIFFDEKWSIFTIIGLIFMFITFYLVPARKDNKKANSKWLLLTLCVLLFSGAYNIESLFIARNELTKWKSEFLIFSFLIASIICLFATVFNVKIKKEPITIKLDWKLTVATLIIATTLGAYNLLNIYALKWFPSYIVMPIINGSIIVMVMVINSILDREKPTLKMIMGTLSAVVGIVLLNL